MHDCIKIGIHNTVEKIMCKAIAIKMYWFIIWASALIKEKKKVG